MKIKVPHYYILLLAVLMPFSGNAFAQHYGDSDSTEFRQHTSWSLSLGPNLLGYSLGGGSSQSVPDEVRPFVGFDAAAHLDFHITERIGLRLSTSPTMENFTIIWDNNKARLLTLGVDLSAMASATFSVRLCSIRLMAGPFTHFVLANWMSNSTYISNPYSRVTGIDPRTGEESFAMSKFNAGMQGSIIIELPTHWTLQADLRYGITDLFDAATTRLYIRPLKATIALGYHFE